MFLRNRVFSVISILLVVLAANVQGAEDKPGHSHDHKQGDACSAILKGPGVKQGVVRVGPIEIIPSGRDGDTIEFYKEAIKIIFGENGVAQQLGFALPPHQIIFTPAADLAALASVGHHPSPTWMDGQAIVHAMKRPSGIMEFVTPGCDTCRSYFRDTTKPVHQLPVLFHVAGHNDVSAHSLYATMRNADPIAASYELYELIDKYYKQYDHDEVALWVQFLTSSMYLQDLSFGTFEHPDSLRPTIANDGDRPVIHVKEKQGLGFFSDSKVEKDVYAEHHGITPRKPTPSVLQALVANLPSDTPRWKREIAEKFEEMNRVFVFVVQTKIMNEGWATFAEVLLAAHSPWNTSHDTVESGLMMARVAFPRLSNPYWMGVEGWLNLYKLFFKEHPEYDKLKLIEKDRKFVEYAHDILKYYNDFQFIRKAFDAQWVSDKKLFLSRKATSTEQDWSIPRDPKHPELNEQKIILSRDPKRIVEWLADRFGNKRQYFPQIWLKNAKGLGRNVFELEHKPYDDLPLERSSAVQHMFVLSQQIKNPVSLTTLKNDLWYRDNLQPGWFFDQERNEWIYQEPKVPKSEPIRIEVGADGKVQVFDLVQKQKDASALEALLGHLGVNQTEPIEYTEQLNAELTNELQKAVDFFREDLEPSLNAEFLYDWQKNLFSEQSMMATEMANKNTAGFFSAGFHAPTVSDAIGKYYDMIKMRSLDALKKALNGKIRPKKTKNGIRVRALPLIPQFEFDQRVKQLFDEYRPPAPKDPGMGDIDPYKDMRLRGTMGRHLKTDQANANLSGRLAKQQNFPSPETQAQTLGLPMFNIQLGAYEKSGTSALMRDLHTLANRNQRTVLVLSGGPQGSRELQEFVHGLTQVREFSYMDSKLGQIVPVDMTKVLLWVEQPSKSGKTELVFKPSVQEKGYAMQISGRLSALDDKGSTPGSGNGWPGDIFWGPGGGGGNGGPGDEPGPPGEDPLDPSEIEISIEEYGKALADELELPNIRRTTGETTQIDFQKADSETKPEGEIDWRKTMVVAHGYGVKAHKTQLSQLKSKIERLKEVVQELSTQEQTPQIEAKRTDIAQEIERLEKKYTLLSNKKMGPIQTTKRGLSVLTESDYVTVTKEPIKQPDFKAVVLFAIDMSGSMMGRRQEVAKELVFNVKALLKHFYKEVEMRFVGFDSEGHEFTEEQIFKIFLGGGTTYNRGIGKGKEILDSYNTAEWNKYMLTIGDGESGEADAQESVKLYDELYKDTQYMGFAYLTLNDWGGGGSWSDPFTTAIKGWASDKEWFGFSEIKNDSQQDVLDAIRVFFGKKNQTK